MKLKLLQHWLIAALFLIVFGWPIVATATSTATSDPTETWLTNAPGYAAAASEQANNGKPFAVYVHADWCVQCKEFKRTILTDANVQELLEPVAKVRLDIDAGEAEEALARMLGVYGLPEFFLIVGGEPKRIDAWQKPKQFSKQLSKFLERK